MHTSCALSIVIPAYNEEGRLGQTLDRILDFIRQKEWAAEVIVVDGCSQDRTPDLVRVYSRNHPIIRLLQIPSNRGKGYCVREGVLNASGSIILFSDADLSSPIEESLHLITALDAGADIAIGSRWARSELQARRQSLARQGLGRIFNLLLRFTLGLNFKDTQCGFKAFRRNAAHTIFALQKIEGWGFDPEILFLARQAGFTIAEVPVRWAHDCRSRINPLADGLAMAKEMLCIRWYSLTGKYGDHAQVAPPIVVSASEQNPTE
ncbi:MAG TPA: dolichyl-phosphate beta-glucosyltransferase [Candidatus Sulfotelmatobacter sp.]|nr:dolichyl-phosphate beta-glucosyltransferase [Candidatus Sulfotelmatobacter sp.]